MNDIVSTISTYSCWINGVLYECGKIVNDPKYVGNLINRKLLNIAKKLFKKANDCCLCKEW